MTTFRIPILGPNTIPDTSGDVYQEPYTIKATNDVWGLMPWAFNDTGTRIGLKGGFLVPKGYVGSALIVPYWTATATSGNVVWDFDYRAVGGDDAESLDQAGTQQSVTLTDAAPTAAHRLLIPTVGLTSANLAADDFVEFEFFRDMSDAADTMAAAALLFGLYFQYADA